MSSLPPYPASELATKSDIARLEGRIDELAARFDEFHNALREQQRTYTVLTIGVLTAQTAVFSLIVGLMV